MRKKALKREFRREVKKSLNRFLSILFIVALGVSLFAGIHSSAPDMRATGDYYFDQADLMDLRVISTLGVTEGDLSAIGDLDGVQAVYGSFMEDVYCQEEEVREVLHVEAILPGINKLTVAQGRLPENAKECFLDSEYAKKYGYEIGDVLTITPESEEDSTIIEQSFIIAGYGYSPNYITYVRGSTTLGTGSLSGFVYVLPEAFDSEAYSVAYIHVDGAKEQMEFTDEYDELVDEVYKQLEDITGIRCEIRYNEIMEEAQSELDEAKQEVEDGKKELADAKQELADGKAEAQSELAEAESELTQGESELEEGKEELADAKKELADGEREIEDGEREIAENAETLADAKSQIASGRNELNKGEKEYKDGLQEFKASKPGAIKKLEEGQAQIDAGKIQLEAGWEEYRSNLAMMEDGEKQLAEAEKQLQEGQDQYDASYDGAKAQLDSALAQYESGMQQIIQGKAAYEAGNAQLAQQQTQYEAGRSQLDSAWNSYNQGKAAIDAGFAQLADAEAGVQSLKAAYEAAKSTSEGLSAEVEMLAGQIAALPSEIETLKNENSSLQQQKAEAEGRKTTAESAAAEKQNQIAGKTALVQQLESAIGVQQAIIDNTEGTYSEEEIFNAKKEKERLNAEKSVLSGELDRLKGELSNLQISVQNLQSEIDGLTGEIAGKTQSITDKEAALFSAQTAYESRHTELEAAKSLELEQKAIYEEAAAALAQEKAPLEEQAAILAGTKAKLDEEEQKMSAAKGQLDAAVALMTEQKVQLDATEKQLVAAKKEIDAGYAQLEASGEQLSTGWSELNAKKQELAAGKQALEQGKNQLESSRAELEAAQKEVNAGYEQLKQAEKTLKSARSELDLGWAQLNASQAQIADGERQLSEGRTQLAEARAELAEGLRKIADAEKEIVENEEKIKDGWKEYEEGKLEAEEEIADGEQKIKDAEEELLGAEQKIKDAEEELLDLKYPDWYVDDRSVLQDHTGFGENAQRLTNIARVFPFLFFLVAALISLTTMTRMVEEERTQIGTLKALGYSKLDIAGKYLKYALFATLGGSVLGVIVGEKLFPFVIITAYGTMYVYLPKVLLPYHWNYALIAAAMALICTLGATTSACYRALQSVPAQLMRPPAPKAGKRVLLEYIPFLWRSLSFSWKSTVRNLMRYKKRFLMTVIGIGGCMGLLLLGYGLRDSIMDIATLQFGELQMQDAMVVLDTDCKEKELQEIREKVEQDTRITISKNFYMQNETVQNTEGMAGKEWTIYLYVPENLEEIDQFFCFRDRENHTPYELTDDGAIITEKIAKEFSVKPGDSIVLKKDDGETVTIPIAEVSENYLSHYLFLTPELYKQIYKEDPEYNSIFFRSDEKQEVLEEIGTDLLNEDAVLNITYTKTLAAQVDDMLGALDSVMIVLIGAAGALAFVVLYNLNNININERRRELATLKVLGFYNGEVGAYVYRENILLTIIGSFLGCFMGKVLHMFIIVTVEVDSCMFGRNIKPMSFVIGTLFTFAFSFIVNWVMYFKLKKIDMVESLKSIE